VGEHAHAAPPVVALRGVARTYPGEPPVEALKPTDLEVRRGEHVAIVGPSGSGKSTMLHLLGLLDRPTAGTYLLDGIDTSTLSDAERAGLRGARIGFVFQAFHLLEQRTAIENVMLSLLYRRLAVRTRRDRAEAVLEQVGLARRINHLPSQLSGGERQRVAIARALVGGPSLLLADEPTGNLDSVTSAEIHDLFDDLHRAGNTVVVITHDPGTARRADRRVRITDGVLAVEQTTGDR
jgi:putative ABC transport system ATP-binding protein